MKHIMNLRQLWRKVLSICYWSHSGNNLIWPYVSGPQLSASSKFEDTFPRGNFEEDPISGAPTRHRVSSEGSYIIIIIIIIILNL